MAAAHLRSISLQSQSHSATEGIEEAELQALVLKANGASRTMSDALSIQTSLRDLGELYQRTEELLCLPCNQRAFSHPNWSSLVERELDASLFHLDLLDAMKDHLGSSKEATKEHRMALRKGHVDHRCRSVAKENAEVKKKINSCLRAMKRIECSSQQTGDLPMVSEARAAAVMILQSIFSSPLLFASWAPINGTSGKWPALVAKAIGKRKVAALIEADGQGSAPATALTESDIEGIEREVECLYRRLIQIRVALLNLLSL